MAAPREGLCIEQVPGGPGVLAPAPGVAPLPSSFRDPAGFVFVEDGVFKRAVTPAGLPDYELFMLSGLYDDLAKDSLVVRHREQTGGGWEERLATSLVPERVDYVSYPYEWSFLQLKDAALLTLEVQRRALRHGMSLKDASAFNVQFRGAAPVFIDTLSFEKNDGGPWVAYQQFCRHFLAPLALMAYVSPSFNRFLAASLDGFPLELACRLLPLSTHLRAGLLLHIHWHARALRNSRRKGGAVRANQPDRKAELTESLRSAVESIELPPQRTEWSDYYREAASYAPPAEDFKKRWVRHWIRSTQAGLVFDLGANTGEYSRLAAAEGARCVSFEMDPICANQNYARARRSGDPRILPLLMDLREPSPSLGFELGERMSMLERPKADLILALALVHHLRITGQIPLARLAGFFGRLGRRLLIEFVPKEDPMVRAMLGHRKDVFADYSWTGFLEAFGQRFELVEAQPIPSTQRTLCHFRRTDEPAG